MLIQAAVNGNRSLSDNPHVPTTPAAISADGQAAVHAGAGALHVHIRDDSAAETLDHEHVARVLTGFRAHCPRVPIGVSTGAWITPDPARRLEQVREWRGSAAPDYASVNFHEEGAVELARLLHSLGIGIEAGISHAAEAERWLASGLAPVTLRVLLEPEAQVVADALAETAAVEAVLQRGAPSVPRLLHGADATAWPFIRLAHARGYDLRIGFEDTLTLPDGTPARSNAELVHAVRALIEATRV